MKMRKRLAGAVALFVVGVLGASACGSGGASGSDDAGGTVTVGVITSLTGPAAGGFSGTENGVKARIEAQNAAGGVEGTKIKYVVADDKSSPDGALAAAKDLVQNRGASAIISVSAVIAGAQPFLLQQGIPTIGGNFGGTEWANPNNTNMFSSSGSTNFDLSATTIPGYLQSKGVKKLGLLAFATSASSQLVVQSISRSSEAIGLDVAYQNENVPFGSTDVGAIAIAMRDAGVDGVHLAVAGPTAFAVVSALKQLGVNLIATSLPAGYGNDLLKQPQAVQAAQGLNFASLFPPVELGTDATKVVVDNFEKYANVTTIPSFDEYTGYVAADAYVRGLEANGGKSDTTSYIESLRGVSGYTAGGLFTEPIDFSKVGVISPSTGPGNCLYFATLEGNQFVPDPTASPTCGELVG